jgi:hypothetical protein
MRRVLDRMGDLTKPVVACFLGRGVDSDLDTVQSAETLEEAASMAVALVTREAYQRAGSAIGEDELDRLADRESAGFAPHQKYVRGLFSGGTLCHESMLVLKDHIGDVHSNTPLVEAFRLHEVEASQEHTVVDLGDKHFTQGRPHPMIDPTLRKARILHEAQDPEAAILLLDVVLGHGSHPDPAGALAAPIAQAKRQVKERGGHLSVVASVCGTEQDVQDREVQEEVLRQAGVVVMPSNAQASCLAGSIARRIGPQS